MAVRVGTPQIMIREKGEGKYGISPLKRAGREVVCAPNHGMAIGDLTFCNAWRYARWSLSGAKISPSCTKSCFSFLVSSMEHVWISCESDCSATTIADMDEKF